MSKEQKQIVSMQDSVTTLGLSTRACNSLLGARIRTIADLLLFIETGEANLYSIRNMGEKGIQEIRGSLSQVTVETNAVTTGRVTASESLVPVYEDRFGQIPPDSPLAALGLNVRVYRALWRFGIETVAQLLQLRDKGEETIYQVRNLGEKGVDEINLALERFEVVDIRIEQEELSPDETQIERVYVISPEVIAWQADLVTRQIRTGTLHREAVLQGHTIGHWLSVSHQETTDRMFRVFANMLGGSLTICDELENLLFVRRRKSQNPDRELYILTERFHPARKKTLQEVANELGISRERVRQLQRQAIRDLVSRASIDAATLRIQSALLIARDMDEELTWNRWHRAIVTSGLCGRWQHETGRQHHPVELMLALCRAVGEDHEHLRLPESLLLAIQLKADERPDVPVGRLSRKHTVPKKLRKEIERHLRFSGGVDAAWLSREFNTGQSSLTEMLLSLDFHCVRDNWFTLSREKLSQGKNQVFCNAINKMLFFCGPLTLEELSSGLGYVVSGTDYPVPPPKALKNILSSLDFTLEDGLCFKEEILDQTLSNSESVIHDCIQSRGKVVHHSELVKAILDSELALPSLHACLKRSPLFDKVDTALYHLRGASFDEEDVARAREAANKVEIDLGVEYFLDGKLTVQLNLSPIAIASGVVVCTSSRFPNLSGKWPLHVEGEATGEMIATDSEFRRLAKAFEILNLEGGERVQFLFDTHTRKVALSLPGGTE